MKKSLAEKLDWPKHMVHSLDFLVNARGHMIKALRENEKKILKDYPKGFLHRGRHVHVNEYSVWVDEREKKK